jgi:hypothetical protein
MADWTKNVTLPAPKPPISIRLDADVLAFFKARGKGYQTHINAVLKAYVEAQKASTATVTGTATATAQPVQNVAAQLQEFADRDLPPTWTWFRQ